MVWKLVGTHVPASDPTVFYMIGYSSNNGHRCHSCSPRSRNHVLKEPTLSCKSAVKPNVTGKMPGGPGNITALSGGFRRVVKRKSRSCFVHATHTFSEGNHLLVKGNCVAGHKDAMLCYLLTSFIGVSIYTLGAGQFLFIYSHMLEERTSPN